MFEVSYWQVERTTRLVQHGRTPRTEHALVAQLVEHSPEERSVGGSIPSESTEHLGRIKFGSVQGHSRVATRPSVCGVRILWGSMGGKYASMREWINDLAVNEMAFGPLWVRFLLLALLLALWRQRWLVVPILRLKIGANI